MELFEEESLEWDAIKIKNIFTQDLVDEIVKIQWPMVVSIDFVVRTETENDLFSMKNCYNLIRNWPKTEVAGEVWDLI